MYKHIILGLVILAIISMFINKNYNIPTQENFTLQTAHPINFECSNVWEDLIKHVRLNETGGIMYTSHYPPIYENCKNIECPYLMKHKNFMCWQCE